MGAGRSRAGLSRWWRTAPADSREEPGVRVVSGIMRGGCPGRRAVQRVGHRQRPCRPRGAGQGSGCPRRPGGSGPRRSAATSWRRGGRGFLDTYNDADRVGRSGAGQLHRRRSSIRNTHERDGVLGGRPGARVDRRTAGRADPGRCNRGHHDRHRGVSSRGGGDVRGSHRGSRDTGKSAGAGGCVSTASRATSLIVLNNAR
jgi:hypothetical protein